MSPEPTCAFWPVFFGLWVAYGTAQGAHVVLSRGTGSIADLTTVVRSALTWNGSVGAEEHWTLGRELRLNREGQRYNGLWICPSPSTPLTSTARKRQRRTPSRASEGNATLG